MTDTVATLSVSTYILIALISAGSSAIINAIFQLIFKRMDIKQKRIDAENKFKDDYSSKKEQAYISALERLRFLRRGLSLTKEQIIVSNKSIDDYRSELNSYREKEAALRLYSTDEIFSMFSILEAHMKPYAYVDSNHWRLTEEGKADYDYLISLLAKLMRKDLGYRKYDAAPEVIRCPECSKEHDIVSTCKCGLTFQQFIKTMVDNIRIEQEVLEGND